MNTTEETPEKLDFIGILKKIFSLKMLICMVLGFSSGLPLYLLFNLISAWLRDANVDLEQIGLFSLVTFAYSFKFLWAPFLDRYNILKLGRRRSWMLGTQVSLLFLIATLGFFEPGKVSTIDALGFNLTLSSTSIVMGICCLISFMSATQDIALDAYRREILSDNELGLGNTFFVNAYRVAGMIPGGLSLILSEYVSWQWVFIVTALFMIPGVFASIFIKEPRCAAIPRTLLQSVKEPFVEFVTRKRVLGALAIIAFIFLYKLGDSMATALATPFYMDMGFEKGQIGVVNKVVGLWTMVIGGFVGGILMLKIGINKALWWFGLGQIITILGYVLIAHVWQYPNFMPNIFANVQEFLMAVLGIKFEFLDTFNFPNIPLLSLVVGAENLGIGLGTACFIAFICRETVPQYVATQLAIFTAIASVPRTVCNSITGYIVNAVGWENFFIICYALAIPGMLMLLYIAPYSRCENVTQK